MFRDAAIFQAIAEIQARWMMWLPVKYARSPCLAGVIRGERNNFDPEVFEEIIETIDRECIAFGIDPHRRFEPGHRR